jgi:integrase
MRYIFKSAFAGEINAFLNHKRELGWKYNSGAQTLSELDRYCVTRDYAGEFSRELVEAWIIDKETLRPSPYRHYLSSIREFGRFLKSSGHPDAYIVSDRFTSRNIRPTPYFLSEKEIDLFFTVCENASSNRRGRSLVMSAFFMLMYCSGLRTVEARTLLLVHTHLEQGHIDIIGSKRHRDRRIFLNEDALLYFIRYDKRISEVFPDRLYFFPSSQDTCLSSSTVGTNFNTVWDVAELRRPLVKQPRPYDFRHHFAFVNINRWTSAGKNVNAMLPYLMRYMGHSSLESTYYYIHLVPDFFVAYARLTESLEDIIPEVADEY